MIAIIIFSVILLALIIYGFVLVGKDSSNCMVGVYGVSIFFFAFIPLIGQGGTILALDELNEEHFM